MNEPVMTFDKEVNAIYIKSKAGDYKRSMSPTITDGDGSGIGIDMVIDYDDEDRIVGIEILL